MKKSKIIGYRLIKPEYEKMVNLLCKRVLDRLTGTTVKSVNADDGGIFLVDKRDLSIEAFKEAGVLDLWFEPVYEEKPKFKDGQWLCSVTHYSRSILRYKGGEEGVITDEYYQIRNSDNKLMGSGKAEYFTNIDNCTVATPEQIKEILILAAKDKGFVKGVKIKEGVKIKSVCSRVGPLVNNWRYNIVEDALYNDHGWYVVYSKGEWATILPNTEVVTLHYDGSTFDIEVSKDGIYYVEGKQWLSGYDLKYILESVEASVSYSDKMIIPANCSNFQFKFTKIDSGCKKGVLVEDWQKVMDLYNKLQKE